MVEEVAGAASTPLVPVAHIRVRFPRQPLRLPPGCLSRLPLAWVSRSIALVWVLLRLAALLRRLLLRGPLALLVAGVGPPWVGGGSLRLLTSHPLVIPCMPWVGGCMAGAPRLAAAPGVVPLVLSAAGVPSLSSPS